MKVGKVSAALARGGETTVSQVKYLRVIGYTVVSIVADMRVSCM
jgi:hypothetical protein